MPEFEVSILTIRSGTHTVHVQAHDAAAARSLAQAECDRGESHCPPEWCTDDAESTVVSASQVALDEVRIVAANSVGLGALPTNDGEMTHAIETAWSRRPA